MRVIRPQIKDGSTPEMSIGPTAAAPTVATVEKPSIRPSNKVVIQAQFPLF